MCHGLSGVGAVTVARLEIIGNIVSTKRATVIRTKSLQTVTHSKPLSKLSLKGVFVYFPLNKMNNIFLKYSKKLIWIVQLIYLDLRL
jgi:hypothetical protein